MLISGVRMRPVMSSPSRITRGGSPGTNSMCALLASCSSVSASRTSMLLRTAASPMARYIAPVSMCGMLSARATSLLTVLLPTPDGPSMATMVVIARGGPASRGASSGARLRRAFLSCHSLRFRLRLRHLLHRREHLHFMLRELAPVTGGQLRIGDRSDRDAAQFRDRMSDGLEHFSNLLIAPFAQPHFVPAVPFVFAPAGRTPRRLHLLNLARHGAFAVDGDAALELADDALVGNAAHFHVIRLHRSMFRMRDLEREVAVVGEEQQSFRLEVETADRIDALAHAFDEIDDRLASFRIVDRRRHLFRFVQEDVAMRLGAGDQLAVDFDVIAIGIRFRSELGDDTAVDRDPSLPNHRLGFTAGRETRMGDDLLQSLELHHSSSA